MMKTLRLSVYMLLFSILYIPIAFSQSYTHWELPEGAKMRLGKGIVFGNIAFSPDNSILAVASSIGVWIYDAHTGKEQNLITNNSGFVESVAFSPDGNTLASCSAAEYYLWDVDKGNLKLAISAHTEDVTNVRFNPNGRMIATCSKYDEEGTIKFWDVSSGKLISNIIAHKDGVDTFAFSPDGTVLISAGEDENGGDFTMKFWNVETGELKETLFLAESRYAYEPQVAFSPDGNTIASCGGEFRKWVKLWDATAGTLKSTLQGHTDGVNTIAFSPDSQTLASGSEDRTMCLWDVTSGTYKTTLMAHTDDIVRIAFSPDGNTIASASSDGTIILWDAKNLLPRTTISEHVTWVNEIDISPDGNYIVSGGRDKIVRLWDTTSGRNIKNLAGHIGSIESVAFSADGKSIASASSSSIENYWFADDYTVRLWDSTTGTHIDTLFGHDRSVNFVDFSPNGRYLISLGGDERAILWDTTTGYPLWTIEIANDYKTIAAFNPDGRTLAIKETTRIRLWDIVSRQSIATNSEYSSGYSNIVFSPDGKTLATAIVGNDVLLWDIATGEEKTIQTQQNGRYVVIAYSPDGQILVTTGTSKHEPIHFWDPISCRLISSLRGMSNGIYSLKFSSDGETFATLGGGGTILLWDYSDIINAIKIEADINSDGVVDINDLVIVAQNFGKTGPNAADVNGDGVVDIADLLIVASALKNADAAPVPFGRNLKNLPTKTDIQKWLSQAQQLDLSDTTLQKGIRFLEQLLLALTPEKTALLPNYPNPFNPETWIPYQLSEPSHVTIQIYAADGQLIRTLDIGEQSAGIYHSRDTAAHWDGRNSFGEPVASGVYFYKFSAGQFSATRRMVIRK